MLALEQLEHGTCLERGREDVRTPQQRDCVEEDHPAGVVERREVQISVRISESEACDLRQCSPHRTVMIEQNPFGGHPSCRRCK